MRMVARVAADRETDDAPAMTSQAAGAVEQGDQDEKGGKNEKDDH